MYVSAYTVPVHVFGTVCSRTFYNAHLNSVCEGLSAQGGGQQEEDVERKHRVMRRGQGDGSRVLGSFLLARSVTQRCVAAGDAN